MNEPMTDSIYPNSGGGALSEACDVRTPSARDQLAEKKKRLTIQLEQVDAALEALDANPEIERVLTLVGRTVRF